MRSLFLIAALTMLLAACGERAEPEEQAAAPSTPATTAAATPTEAPAATAKPVTVRTADGAELMTVSEKDGVVQISWSSDGQKKDWRGETRDGGKRKYSSGTGPVTYEVKPGDDGGFKLRTADGALRWKVKVTPEKIKISDNEQNANPFELKVREGDRVKLVGPGEKEIGNVRFDRTAAKTEIENAAGKTLFTADGTSPSGAWGVLLLDGIPPAERSILVAEILSRGR